VQNRKYLIYFGSQKTRTEIHNGSFGSVSSVPVLGYFGSVPRFRFFLPRPSRGCVLGERSGLGRGTIAPRLTDGDGRGGSMTRHRERQSVREKEAYILSSLWNILAFTNIKF
jgi:hypothetical protein